ncbi:hypothetical protein Misp02_29150 [Microtetraspora sp. NBRC 16547]|nr:hypothetical protein Misp02_29150 [Microtetraspora sp. NBRC 16547]
MRGATQMQALMLRDGSRRRLLPLLCRLVLAGPTAAGRPRPCGAGRCTPPGDVAPAGGDRDAASSRDRVLVAPGACGHERLDVRGNRPTGRKATSPQRVLRH